MDTSADYQYHRYGYTTSSVPLTPVQPLHPALLQQHPSTHITSLNGYSGHNMSLNHPGSSDGSEMHEKITVTETPQPKQRRRRGTAAAARASSPEPKSSTSQTPLRSTSSQSGIIVKTKFPVARIKRIMQADEDVGKVAQVTPVIVSKALELFMISMCTKACNQARGRNSKRITAAHLKQVANQDEKFDFLADIMSKVPDIPLPQEGSGNGDSPDEGAPGSVKKPRKPRTRKPKDEDC